MLTEGWDSVALDVDDRLIFKFPRNSRAARSLGVYAQLHALPAMAMRAAGAEPIEAWLAADEKLRRAWPSLPDALRPYVEDRIAAWQALPPDPLGMVFGFFDGHGWNMAFDHQFGRLNGLYDFGDAGFGAVHRELIYSNWVSRDSLPGSQTAMSAIPASIWTASGSSF